MEIDGWDTPGVALQKFVRLAQLNDRTEIMVLWSALVVDRDNGITVSGYHRCPGPNSGFVAAYEPSAMHPKNGRKWAEAILRAEDIEAIAFKSGWILDVPFST